jgi:hypothetical protein
MLSRYELRNKIREEATLYSLNPIVYITDMSIGVQYAIDKYVGNCTIRPFVDYIYDKFLPNIHNNVIDLINRLQKSQSFLNENVTYVYTGEKNANGIPVVKYMANINNNILEYTFTAVRTKISYKRSEFLAYIPDYLY